MSLRVVIPVANSFASGIAGFLTISSLFNINQSSNWTVTNNKIVDKLVYVSYNKLWDT